MKERGEFFSLVIYFMFDERFMKYWGRKCNKRNNLVGLIANVKMKP
jgi:hypothetical protein